MPNKPALRLLPNYFKKIGITLSAMVVLTFVYLVTVRPVVVKSAKDATAFGLASAAILALLLIATARDKIEDELTQLIRLKAMAFTFLMAVGFTIVYPFTKMLAGLSIKEVGGYQLVGTMLLVYLLSFSVLKRAS